MKVMFPSKLLVLTAGLVLSGQGLIAQNTIQLFTPINNRTSPTSAGFGPPHDNGTPYSFGSTTLSLTCGAGATASLAGLTSESNPSGKLIVDNNIFVTAYQGAVSNAPTNVCTGGVNLDSSFGISANHCFQLSWESDFSNYVGQNPDTFSSTYGVPPITIDPSLLTNLNFDTTKPLNLTVSLEDEGGVLASSSVFLTTSCTINGVTGPSTVGGNPITGDSGKTQTFDFNPLPGKQVGFSYDVSGVTNFSGAPDGSIPQTTDSPIDVTSFRPDWVAGTPFATSSCFVHFGEVLSDGLTAACKLYSLECASQDGSTTLGANCPKSSTSNEKVVDHFDGPALQSLPNIYNTAGKLIAHEGVGFLMASEGWAPSLPTPAGQCMFEAASGLSGVACPQNLLRDFSGPGAFSGTGLTTNPNSTFISIYGVPEPLTAVNLQGAKAGNWVNTNQPQVGFLTSPPNLTNGANTISPISGLPVPLDGAANFIPAPIKSITYGISPASAALPTPLQEPALNDPLTGTDITLMNKTCPTSFSALTEPSYGPPRQTIFSVPGLPTPIPDGQYIVHYYSQDCAGTQELQFTTNGQVNNEPVWSTSFYTLPVNIDTTPPQAVFIPPAAPYKVGTTQVLTYYCTDATTGSGITHCSTNAWATGTVYDTRNVATLTTKLNTSTAGSKTFPVTATDGAGNTVTVYFNYSVTK